MRLWRSNRKHGSSRTAICTWSHSHGIQVTWRRVLHRRVLTEGKLRRRRSDTSRILLPTPGLIPSQLPKYASMLQCLMLLSECWGSKRGCTPSTPTTYTLKAAPGRSETKPISSSEPRRSEVRTQPVPPHCATSRNTIGKTYS